MRFIFLLFLITPLYGYAKDSKVEEDFSKETVEFFHDYIKGYNQYLADSNNAKAMDKAAEHFYMPLMQFPINAGPTVTNSHQKLSANLAYFTDTLRKSGVVNLKWEKLNIVPLRENMALANNIANAVDGNGKLVLRLTTIYTLYKSDNGWKIASITPYSATNLFELDKL